MKKYLTLLAYELENSKKLIAILVGGVTLLQSVSFIQMIREYKLTLSVVASQGGMLENVRCDFMTFVHNRWFILSIMGSVVLIGAYIFYIWLKEWYKQGKSIYRVLMLPGSRMSVYWAKFTTIFILILLLLGLEIGLISVAMKLAGGIVGDNLMNTGNSWYVFVQGNSYFGNALEILYPANLIMFLTTYGVGICVVSTCFQLIILAMSTRHLRKVQSIGLMIINLAVVILYAIGSIFLAEHLILTSGEINWLITLSCVIYFAITTLVSRHLLNHYIAV